MQIEIPDRLIEEAVDESVQDDAETAVCASVIHHLANWRGRREAEREGEQEHEHKYVQMERSRLDRECDLYIWQRTPEEIERLKE